MPAQNKNLNKVQTFPQLVAWLRDELDWPLESNNYEDISWEYDPEELGLKKNEAAKIDYIRQLRPMTDRQPFGIFFVKFNKGRLPVVALRRILSNLVVKRRASANKSDRPAWEKNDLLFLSSWGEKEQRQMNFAHFADNPVKKDLPTLKVLDWGKQRTGLHVKDVEQRLHDNLSWPEDQTDQEEWRKTWRGAFTVQHQQVIKTSKELAEKLAVLAGDIRDRIREVLRIESDKGPVTQLMQAFRKGLVHDLDEDGFADMYAQTIAYGLLSARIENPSGRTADDLPATMPVTNPFLKELMETFIDIGGRKKKAGGAGIDFDEFGISDVIELLDGSDMEAVVRDFGDEKREKDPVIHFYEDFLQRYDPEERKKKGVFYTPQPVVSFIVRSVDELLRTEFGLEDGLADITTWGEMAKRHKDLSIPDGAGKKQRFVQILDPATGTGTFPVEVIDVIYNTMTSKWKKQGKKGRVIDKLWNEYVPKYLLPRLHGYELLMAPYTIAHLKIGLKLFETGYRFESDERARIYLTNALEPARDDSGTFEFAIPALANETEAVDRIKLDQIITVVIGNPPYSIESGNLSPACRALVDNYRYVDGMKISEKSAIVFERTLQDDYVKFFALAQNLLERSQAGISCYISNNSFLENINLRGLRNCIYQVSDSIVVIDLHGDADKKEVSASGDIDKNVFDIKKGVSILLTHRSGLSKKNGFVARADILGSREEKYSLLSTASASSLDLVNLQPKPEQYLFLPVDEEKEREFRSGICITDIFINSATGIETGKDSILLDTDKDRLRKRLIHFGDPALSDTKIRKEFGAEKGCGRKIADHRKSIPTDPDFEERLVELTFAPFDKRWVFYRKDVINVHSYNIAKHLLDGANIALLAMRQVSLSKSYTHFFVTNSIANNRAFYSTRGKAYMFPLYVGSDLGQLNLGESENLQPSIGQLLLPNESKRKANMYGAIEILAYVYAALHSNVYRNRYDALLRNSYAHIPKPATTELFEALRALGDKLINLHLLKGIDKSEFRTSIAGHSTPLIERPGWTDDCIWFNPERVDAKAGQIATETGTNGILGVSKETWGFHIGGYQVCHKWLKDRKGSRLSSDDMIGYQKIIYAISETIRIMAEIDEVIEQHGGWPNAFVAEADNLPKAAEDSAGYDA